MEFILRFLASIQLGLAVWYGPGFIGQTMANGKILTPGTNCVAHRTLPLGTRVQLYTQYGTMQSVVMDRGPWGIEERIVDLCPLVADQLMPYHGVTTSGVPYGMEPVLLWVLEDQDANRDAPADQGG